jgi:hypothetical protein
MTNEGSSEKRKALASRVQDQTIGAIYDVIRGINQQVGTLASELLHEAAKRRGARAEASSKHHTGTR